MTPCRRTGTGPWTVPHNCPQLHRRIAVLLAETPLARMQTSGGRSREEHEGEVEIELGVISLADLCARSLATASKRNVAISIEHLRGPVERNARYIRGIDEDIVVLIGEVDVHNEGIEESVAALAGSKCTMWRREHPRRHREEMEK